MIQLQTIQKVAKAIGVEVSYLRTMIENEDLTAYEIDGSSQTYISIEEFNSSLKAVKGS